MKMFVFDVWKLKQHCNL